MENRVNSTYNSLQTRLEKRFSKGSDRAGQLHVGRGAHRRARSHLDQRRRRRHRHRHFREPQDGFNLRAERGPAEFDIDASVRRELRLGAAVRPRPPFRQRLEPADGLRCSAAGS